MLARLLAMSLVVPAGAQAQAPAQPAVREITQIAGEVYRFRNRLGTKADVVAFRGYLEDLRAQVLAAVRAGKSLEETGKIVDPSKYEDRGGYEQMGQLNIEGVYRLVQATRRPNQ